MKFSFTKNKLWLAGAFLAGALAGSVVTWLCTDTREYTLIVKDDNKQDPFIAAVEAAEAEQKQQQKTNGASEAAKQPEQSAPAAPEQGGAK